MKLNFLNMKSVQLLLILALGVATISCEKLGLTAPKMDTEEAMQRIVDSYKNIDTIQYKPIQIQWYEYDKLTNDLVYLNVDAVGKEDNKVYTQSMKIGGDNQSAGEMKPSSFYSRSNFDFNDMTYIKSSDINSELILKHIENAKAQIPEEYVFKSVGNYYINADQQTKELKYKFDFRLTMKGESTQVQGRQIVTNYYELSFKGFADGSVEMKD